MNSLRRGRGGQPGPGIETDSSGKYQWPGICMLFEREMTLAQVASSNRDFTPMNKSMHRLLLPQSAAGDNGFPGKKAFDNRHSGCSRGIAPSILSRLSTLFCASSRHLARIVFDTGEFGWSLARLTRERWSIPGKVAVFRTHFRLRARAGDALSDGALDVLCRPDKFFQAVIISPLRASCSSRGLIMRPAARRATE